MSFNRENVSRVRADFVNRRREAAAESDRRKAELYEKLPELRGLDRQIASVGVQVMGAAIGGGDVDGALSEMKKNHTALRARRAEMLIAAGYPADYSDIRYRCETCLDTGFVGTKMCTCMRRALVMAGYESAGIGTLMQTQGFDSFSLSYYSGAEQEGMEHNLAALTEFARHFSAHEGESWLLIGATGLGKTHLSTSVAREVIDAGYDVVYETAQGVFSVFEAQRFGRGEAEDGAADRYFDCDLLIIDDLGTELSNQFTVSCLYNIINSRVNSRRSTIINTNLTGAELRARYADRITSRLFGEFKPLLFAGKDVRAQKLKAGK